MATNGAQTPSDALGVCEIDMSTNEPERQESAGRVRQQRLDGELVESDDEETSCGALTCTDADRQSIVPANAIFQKVLNPKPCGNCFGDRELGEIRHEEQSLVRVQSSSSVHKVENADVEGQR